MAFARQRYGAVTNFRRAATDCVCDSGHEWCCTNRNPVKGLVPGARYYPMNFTSGLFGDETPETLRDKLTSEPVTTVAAAALTYHGYKRTGSILWAIAYGFAGKMIPLVAVPVSLAQGFGKRKEGC